MVTSPTTVPEGDTSTIFAIVLTLSQNIFTVSRDIVYDVELQDGNATGKCNGSCKFTIAYTVALKSFYSYSEFNRFQISLRLITIHILSQTQLGLIM